MLKFPYENGLELLAENYSLEATSRPGNGLKVVLSRNRKLDRYDICTGLSFIVHSPYELASSYDSTETCEFHFGFDFDVLITPEIIKTDKDLKHIDPEKRGCYFEGEKKLKFFKVYTKRNCEFECIGDYLFQKADVNCSQFFMVRNESTVVCDYRQETHAQYYSLFALESMNDKSTGCGCLDACDSIKYNVEIVSHTLAEYNVTLDKRQVKVEVSLNFKFKDVDVVPLRRYQQITFTDFLAQSGGMMGLFAGISALSIIELFYFLTLRWMVNFCRWITTRK